MCGSNSRLNITSAMGTLKKADEPQPASTDKFMASYSEASPAYEPEKLSETDFIPNRLARLVRQALEDEIIS